MLAITLSPALTPIDTEELARQLEKPPDSKKNFLYIEKIGVKVQVNEIINGDEESAFLGGSAHRAPKSGNPESGSNFVIAAHRFSLGVTPENTIKRSPLYHIEKLEIGDEFYVDWSGKRYTYDISEIKTVKPTAVEIEYPTKDNRLTLYTCSLGGR